MGRIHPQAVVISKLHIEDFPGIIQSLAGILFLGTPHKGSKWQSSASIIASIASTLGFGEESLLLKVVQQDSEMLRDLIQDFTRTINRSSVPLFCFFEQQKSDITRLIKSKTSLIPAYKVRKRLSPVGDCLLTRIGLSC
jgi:hypothetical protein